MNLKWKLFLLLQGIWAPELASHMIRLCAVSFSHLSWNWEAWVPREFMVKIPSLEIWGQVYGFCLLCSSPDNWKQWLLRHCQPRRKLCLLLVFLLHTIRNSLKLACSTALLILNWIFHEYSFLPATCQLALHSALWRQN